MKSKRKPPLALADIAGARHTILLVAAEQRVVAIDLVTTTLTADAVDDLRNLTHLIEGDAGAWEVGELFGR